MLLVTQLSQDWDWHMNKETRSENFSNFPDMSILAGKTRSCSQTCPWFKEETQCSQTLTQRVDLTASKFVCVLSLWVVHLPLHWASDRTWICWFITPSFITFQWTSTLDHGWWNTAAHVPKQAIRPSSVNSGLPLTPFSHDRFKTTIKMDTAVILKKYNIGSSGFSQCTCEQEEEEQV